MAGKRIGKLTARFVETVKTPGLHGDGGNLFLKIDEGGSRSWMFRHQRNGKVRKYGLGPTHTVSLSDARQRAEDVRRQLLDGVDPREARQAEAAARAGSITFDQAVDRYIDSHRAGWKSDKHTAQWQATLSAYASPVFGHLPVAAIDTALVMKILKPIWSSKNETAHRVRGRIESVLSWAKVHGFRTGENPALWRGHLDHLLPARSRVHQVEHHAALPYNQVPAFIAELRDRDGVAARALELTILCATRTSETLGATWLELDLEAGLWTIPKARMKAGKEHRIPIGKRVIEIVKVMRTNKQSDFVFPGSKKGKPLSIMAMPLTLRRMERGDITVHGFRSSFRDWCAEQTNFPRELAEAALAHVIGNKTEAAYQRGDLLEKRRQLMDAWAAHCDGRIKANVVPLRK